MENSKELLNYYGELSLERLPKQSHKAIKIALLAALIALDILVTVAFTR